MKSILKRILPSETLLRAKRLAHRMNLVLVGIAYKSDLGSSLYYLLFSSEFRREHRAVLAGKLRYWQSLELDADSYFQLRRNTHRIEKGLIMRPRRAAFAEGYIGETVAFFNRAVKSLEVCSEEIEWAREVLTTYFNVVISTPRIKAARDAFEGAHARGALKRVPYKQKSLPSLTVDFKSFEELCIRRRSVRWYRDTPVPLGTIREIIRVASLAPSACNRQPFAFYIRTGAEAARLASLAGGAVGFADSLPCCIAVVGNLGAYPFERDRHLIYIDGALSSMQLMLASETVGLSTCPINWPDDVGRNSRIQKMLNLDLYQHTVMLIGIGYADPEGGVPFSAKRNVDKLVRLGPDDSSTF